MFRFWLKYTDGIADYMLLWAELQAHVTEVMYSNGRNAGAKMGQANQHIERLLTMAGTRSNGKDDFTKLCDQIHRWVETLGDEQNQAQYNLARLFRSKKSYS